MFASLWTNVPLTFRIQLQVIKINAPLLIAISIKMYRIAESQTLTSATTELIEGVYLSALLNGIYNTKQVLLCPTDAISLSQNFIIPDKCISCGICKKVFPSEIDYIHSDADYSRFQKYLLSHKMLTYRWISLMTDSLSGTEIKVRGFSRDIRIPLVIVGDTVNIVKCASSSTEIDKVLTDLDNMEYLILEDMDIPNLEKTVVLIEDNFAPKLTGSTGNNRNVRIDLLVDLYRRFTCHF